MAPRRTRRGTLSDFHSHVSFFPCCGASIRCALFGKRQFVLISNSAQSGWRPSSNFTNVWVFFFFSFLLLRAQLRQVAALWCHESKVEKTAEGAEARGWRWRWGGGSHWKTVTGLKRLILTLLYLVRQGPKHLVCVCEPISSWSGNEPVWKMLSKSSHTPVASLELLFFFHPGLMKINLKKYFFFC